jgi:hypothetical protein
MWEQLAGLALSAAGNYMNARDQRKTLERQAEMDAATRAEIKNMLTGGFTGPLGKTTSSGQELTPEAQGLVRANLTGKTESAGAAANFADRLRNFRPAITRADASAITARDDARRGNLYQRAADQAILQDVRTRGGTSNQFGPNSNFARTSQDFANRNALGGETAAEGLFQSSRAGDLDAVLKGLSGATAASTNTGYGVPLSTFESATLPSAGVMQGIPTPGVAPAGSMFGDMSNALGKAFTAYGNYQQQNKLTDAYVDALGRYGQRYNSGGPSANTQRQAEFDERSLYNSGKV